MSLLLRFEPNDMMPGDRRQTFPRILGGVVNALATALWIGGLLGIGAIVAPTAAHLIHTNSVFVNNKDNQQAVLIGIIGGSLRIFNLVCYVCGGLMLLGDLLQGIGSQPGYCGATLFRSIMALVLLASVLVFNQLLFPAMDQSREVGNMMHFDRLHKLYEGLSELQLIPLMLIIAATAWRDSRAAGS